MTYDRAGGKNHDRVCTRQCVSNCQSADIIGLLSFTSADECLKVPEPDVPERGAYRISNVVGEVSVNSDIQKHPIEGRFYAN